MALKHSRGYKVNTKDVCIYIKVRALSLWVVGFFFFPTPSDELKQYLQMFTHMHFSDCKLFLDSAENQLQKKMIF